MYTKNIGIKYRDNKIGINWMFISNFVTEICTKTSYCALHKAKHEKQADAARGYLESAREPQPQQEFLEGATLRDEPGLLFLGRELLNHGS